MPIHDLGYRPWKGQKSLQAMRWWVITYNGARVVWKNLWLRRMLMVAWLPAVYIGMGFFVYEQYIERSQRESAGQREEADGPPQERQLKQSARRVASFQMFRGIPDGDLVLQELQKNPDAPEKLRHMVWAWLLMLFFRYPQGLLMLLVVGLIAPPLIAKDVRSRGFLLYFSRPISPLEYLLGKAAILWIYLMLITMLPALLLYCLGVMLSPNFSVVLDTWDLPLRIVGASVALMVPTTGLALLFSSLTTESRFAGFAWFTVWALGAVAFLLISATRRSYDPLKGEWTRIDPHWTAVSLYHTLANVQRWIFGIAPSAGDVWYSVAILVGLTVFSLIVLLRRVSAPIRV